MTQVPGTPERDRDRQPGRVSLVGAGPGDPGLITVAGLKRLQHADVVVYDRLSGDDLLNRARPDAERIYVGKAPGRHSHTQDEINAILVEQALQGRNVCRLKGGDPFVFGRGGEEALACLEAGVPFEVVPGVTSAIAAAAYAGIPVTHRQVAASFAVVTGHEDQARSESGVQWDRLAQAIDTLVLLMGVERLPRIVADLIAAGRPPEMPAAVIQWGTLPWQQTVTGRLDNIVERCRDAKISSPAITIIGNVVSLRNRLAWFDHRPLFGRQVLVTRSRDQASELAERLQEAGAWVRQFPSIRIRPFQLAECAGFGEILHGAYDWILFASANAVRCFFSLVREAGGDARSVGRSRIAAVGPLTAAAVEGAGLRVDFVPEEATSERLIHAFPEAVSGKKMLIPRALVAPDSMPETLRTAGAEVTLLPVYETIEDVASEECLRALRSGDVDFITFTSSSTVRNLLKQIPVAEIAPNAQVACIGPATAETARSAGLRVDVVAEPHTVAGLARAVVELATRDGRAPSGL